MFTASLPTQIGIVIFSFLLAIYLLKKFISFLIKNKKENDKEKENTKKFYLIFGNRPQGTSQRTVDETLRKLIKDVSDFEEKEEAILELIVDQKDEKEFSYFNETLLKVLKDDPDLSVQDCSSIGVLRKALLSKLGEKTKKFNNALELAQFFYYNV